MILITISRMIGAGGEVISERLAKELGLEFYNDEHILFAARKMGLNKFELEGLDEKRPGLIERLWSWRSIAHLDILQAVVYDIARRGNAVIVDHGAQAMLKGFDCALHVHLQAPFKKRVERIMELHGLGLSEAENIVRNSDQQRSEFLHYAFHINWEDPSFYDIVINTERVGIDAALEMIIDGAKSGRIKPCGKKAMDYMARLALARRAEARLLEVGFSYPSLSVISNQPGILKVSGWVTYTDHEKIIRRTLEEIPEVNEVQLNIIARPVDSE